MLTCSSDYQKICATLDNVGINYGRDLGNNRLILNFIDDKGMICTHYLAFECDGKLVR